MKEKTKSPPVNKKFIFPVSKTKLKRTDEKLDIPALVTEFILFSKNTISQKQYEKTFKSKP